MYIWHSFCSLTISVTPLLTPTNISHDINGSKKAAWSFGGPLDCCFEVSHVIDDGTAAICQLCIGDGKNVSRSTVRSSSSASNLYAHIRHVHPDVYAILEPVVRFRDKNKRHCVQSSTIQEMFSQSRTRKLNDALSSAVCIT